jgi:hypothetical protein
VSEPLARFAVRRATTNQRGISMVTVRIGNDTRSLEDVDESWITQQVGSRQHEGVPVCVEVKIQEGTLDLRLTTPACGSGGPGGRQPRPEEAEIFRLWDRLGLGSDDFSGGNVVAFIKQLRGRL